MPCVRGAGLLGFQPSGESDCFTCDSYLSAEGLLANNVFNDDRVDPRVCALRRWDDELG